MIEKLIGDDAVREYYGKLQELKVWDQSPRIFQEAFEMGKRLAIKKGIRVPVFGRAVYQYLNDNQTFALSIGYKDFLICDRVIAAYIFSHTLTRFCLVRPKNLIRLFYQIKGYDSSGTVETTVMDLSQ